MEFLRQSKLFAVSIPLSSLHGLQLWRRNSRLWSTSYPYCFHTAKQSSRSATSRTQFLSGGRYCDVSIPLSSLHGLQHDLREEGIKLPGQPLVSIPLSSLHSLQPWLRKNPFHSNPKRPFPLIPLILGSLPAAKGPFQGRAFNQFWRWDRNPRNFR